jgi:hypothetical protein
MSQDESIETPNLLAQIVADARHENRPGEIRPGYILEITKSGTIIVVDAEDEDQRMTCDVLHSGGPLPHYEPGMSVLVWCASVEARRGIILGRVMTYNRHDPGQYEDDLVIEANETLRLKCGDSSVDLRKDGKVMIRGKDVLTRAKRTNRIKGGSVGIN